MEKSRIGTATLPSILRPADRGRMEKNRIMDGTLDASREMPVPAPPRRFPALVPLNGSFRQTNFLLSRQVSTIGRGISSEVLLQDESVAARHARVIYANFDEPGAEPDCRLFDAGSGAGTFVNDEPVGKGGVALHENDRIRVGDTLLVYFLRAENEPDTLARRLEEAATRDHLTGLYARGVFIGSLEREIARARRYFRNLSLLLAQVDNLAQINRGYGRTSADNALRGVAAIFNGYLRQTDLLARYDEAIFAALLTETDLAGARIVAERMCNAVARKGFGESNNLFHATLSIGITNSRRPTMSAGDFTGHAFDALKKALEAGGNTFDVVLPPGEPQD